MPPNDYPTEPSIPCGCGRAVSEIEMAVKGKLIDLCLQCVCELFPQHKGAILKQYRDFHKDAYGYDVEAQN